MRFTIFMLLLIPTLSQAQVNRSAKELASEKIQEYVTVKLFKDMPYKAVSYGELKSYGDKKSDISWYIAHKFEVVVSETVTDKRNVVRKPYNFIFFLDDKMKVVKAETSYMN
ncbi:MAG: hypothetical protein H7Y42_15850 [Chitinophagaceae bacterium]|nr:hypothetical protein [Chitinophagaceae bacterium]